MTTYQIKQRGVPGYLNISRGGEVYADRDMIGRGHATQDSAERALARIIAARKAKNVARGAQYEIITY